MTEEEQKQLFSFLENVLQTIVGCGVMAIVGIALWYLLTAIQPTPQAACEPQIVTGQVVKVYDEISHFSRPGMISTNYYLSIEVEGQDDPLIFEIRWEDFMAYKADETVTIESGCSYWPFITKAD